MTGILIEGVTGAGKSETLRALIQHSGFSNLLDKGRVFNEDETFGEFMSEIQTPGVPSRHHFRRLENVLTQLERLDQQSGFVLERFHLSYYALLPDWDLFAEIDDRLSRLNCLTVLLHIPEEELEARCLDRDDRAATTWLADMVAHFGSREAALEAVVQSTRRRNAAARRSSLRLREIDTGTRDWKAYANEIVKEWSALCNGLV